MEHNKLSEITQKLYEEGLAKGRAEGEQIIAEAEARAKQIVARAEETAAEIVRKATEQATEQHSNIMAEIAACRETLAKIKDEIASSVVARPTVVSPHKAILDPAMLMAVARLLELLKDL
jgi:V/A-type H+-transporting ATPase subunit E